MKIFNLDANFISNNKALSFINKQQQQNNKIAKIVQAILKNIQKHQDVALLKYCQQFDGLQCQNTADLLVNETLIKNSENNLDKSLKEAINLAYERIFVYHQKQMPQNLDFTDNLGVKLGNHWRPISKIGLYVPGGTASYPSSVLMSAIPALVAKVDEIIMCMPVKNNEINQAVLYCAKLCGIKTIYTIGGAQAIAAMAFGTQTIKKVNKIVGPGNAFVALAKKMVYGNVGIDSIAGPTDICIIADETANPKWLAYDALSQLEHGADSKAFLITNSKQIARDFVKYLAEITKTLERSQIITQSSKNSAVFVVSNLHQATELANIIAPEHLEIVTENPQNILPHIKNAGAVFLGNYTPEAIGDYMAGPSHTLPTFGSANFASGLSVYDFLKRISIIDCNQEAFEKLASATKIFAEAENLQAHKFSIAIRQKDFGKKNS
jgi:histidinol dehydrogenase